MEAFQLVGCVLSSGQATELIDAFVAQVRRERAVVMVKSAQGSTFVRFNATDARLVALACKAVADPAGTLLRFGFAGGARDAAPAAAESPTVATRSIVEANDLAAGAGDGEVLISPQLAATLIEAGFGMRTKQIHLPGGRTVAACALDVPGAPRSAPAGAAAAASSMTSAPSTDARALLQPSRGGEAAGSAVASAGGIAPAQAQALGAVLRTLAAQSEEMARRQLELEARQDAVLAKMRLVDEGSGPVIKHLAQVEAELDAQLARVEGKIAFIGDLEQRFGQLHKTAAAIEGALADQPARRAELDSLKALSDELVQQMVEAQHRVQAVSAAQQQLQPLAAQATDLVQSLQEMRSSVEALQQRLDRLEVTSESLDLLLASIASREQAAQVLKLELERVRELGEAGRNDLQFMSAQRETLAELRVKVEALSREASEADGKLAQVESRRKLAEELQVRTEGIGHMLADIQLHLEMIGEQRPAIEHAGEKLARLEFMLQEAQNTLRALQREREVAERIEQGLKSLRARSVTGPPG
jgi:chromosome segregation ATPase